jgi:hypothetical protein
MRSVISFKEIVLVRICERSVEACNVCEEDRKTMKTSGYRVSYSRSELPTSLAQNRSADHPLTTNTFLIQ